MRVLLAAAAAGLLGGAPARAGPDYEAEFRAFKLKFGKQYAEAEERARFATFVDNVDFIEATNAKGLTYTLGVGRFADLTEREFLELHTSPNPAGRPAPPFLGPYLGEHQETPAPAQQVDWVAEGAVTAVKNQGSCGDCWAFAATGALEGASAIATGTLVNFSTQEFVDCVPSGCHGGWSYKALAFAVNHTLCTWDSYPYTADGSGMGPTAPTGTNCTRIEPKLLCTAGIPKGRLSGYKSVAKTEAALVSALSVQPVAINMMVERSMMHYKSGVLSYSNCSQGTNHGVLAVGYGTAAAPSVNGTVDPSGAKLDYWKVKNSWGMQFGMEGYFLLARGVYPSGCGTASTLLTSPAYPVMAE